MSLGGSAAVRTRARGDARAELCGRAGGAKRRAEMPGAAAWREFRLPPELTAAGCRTAIVAAPRPWTCDSIRSLGRSSHTHMCDG